VVVLRINATLQADGVEHLQAFLNDMKAQGVEVETAVQSPAWLCGSCGLLSFNANDADNGYCGCCGSEDLPKHCQHRRPWRS
jgi:ribosomal protein S27AE